MAKLVVRRNQQAEMERAHPKPAYSRVITLELVVAAGIGEDCYNYTDRLGTNLWLLGVDVWVTALALNGECGGFFQISTGFDKPASSEEVALKWKSLFQHKGIKPFPSFRFYQGGHLRFSMRRFWNGQPRRFGVYIANFSATDGMFALFAFEISEG